MIYAEPLYWPGGVSEAEDVFDTDFARVAAHSCGDLSPSPSTGCWP